MGVLVVIEVERIAGFTGMDVTVLAPKRYTRLHCLAGTKGAGVQAWALLPLPLLLLLLLLLLVLLSS